jgi:GntR family transcriptional regulator, transcriptional repressor for pyruvate dehydrogenase complex
MAADDKTETAGSAFRPLRPPRNLTSELTARLTEEIVSGKLAPSSRLPTEQEMIATFGVSRTVVREAIAALRAEGLVISRQGSGIFVTGDMTQRPFRLDADGLKTLQGVIDLMELRMSVEVEAAGLAAERRTPDDVADIARSLGAFERAVAEGDDAVDADYLFHLAVSKATRNDYFRSFIEYLGLHIIPRRSIHIGAQSNDDRQAYLAKVSAEHRNLLEAIEAGNPAAARAAMRKHLREGRDRYINLVRTAA